MSLSSSPALIDLPYVRYYLGEDGLIAGSSAYPSSYTGGETGGIPPFPLEDLMNFLTHYRTGSSPELSWGDYIAVLTVLVLAIPGLVRFGGVRRKKGGFFLYNDKRIAA
jgi:hypothetical protein